MSRIQIIAIVIVLVGAGGLFALAQERSYRIDPPTQTDRMSTKGWPHRYRRAGGIAGFNEVDRSVYLANLSYFYGPALLVCLAIGAGPRLFRGAAGGYGSRAAGSLITTPGAPTSPPSSRA